MLLQNANSWPSLQIPASESGVGSKSLHFTKALLMIAEYIEV